MAIETSRGLLVACLRATGRPVFPINPMSVSRYRDRHSVARRKSDAGDALVLANILRTDLAAHRPLPADSELAQAIAVLARAQQDAVWARTDAHNKLRSLLREYYPAILAAFATKRGGLLRPEARALLAAAPTPRAAARLTLPSCGRCCAAPGCSAASTPKPTGSSRCCAPTTCTTRRWSRRPSGSRPWPCCASSTPPAPTPNSSPTATAERFAQHPDAAIITSMPGLADADRRPDPGRDRRRPRPLRRRATVSRPTPAAPR